MENEDCPSFELPEEGREMFDIPYVSPRPKRVIEGSWMRQDAYDRLQAKLAAHAAILPDLRAVLDELDHRDGCGVFFSGYDYGCNCGYDLSRAHLERAIRVLEGE